LGHPSGSDGRPFTASRSRMRKKKMPRLDAPRRKRAVEPLWAFGWLRNEFSAIVAARHLSCLSLAAAVSSFKKCPGSALPGGNERSSLNGHSVGLRTTISFCGVPNSSAQTSRNFLRGYLEMPRFGRARRKTRPNLYGHSVGSLTRFLLACVCFLDVRE
jgi:hypothetical protein